MGISLHLMHHNNLEFLGRGLPKIAVITIYIIIHFWLGILLLIPPAGGYEVSIYGAYPAIFWFLLISTIVLSIGCTIYFLFLIEYVDRSAIFIVILHLSL